MSQIQSPPALHRLALFRDEAWLARAVGGYLATALGRGEGALAITLPSRWERIQADLAGRAVPAAPGRVMHLDAEATLAAILAQGISVASLRAAVGPAIAQLRESTGVSAVRAYGDMVDVLWLRGEESPGWRSRSSSRGTSSSSPRASPCSAPIRRIR
jgi:hypothetical protein